MYKHNVPSGANNITNNLLVCFVAAVTVGVVYLLAEFCWRILSFLLLQHNLSVVASSALFGLLAAMLSHLLHANIRSIHKVSCTTLLASFFPCSLN